MASGGRFSSVRARGSDRNRRSFAKGPARFMRGRAFSLIDQEHPSATDRQSAGIPDEHQPRFAASRSSALGRHRMPRVPTALQSCRLKSRLYDAAMLTWRSGKGRRQWRGPKGLMDCLAPRHSRIENASLKCSCPFVIVTAQQVAHCAQDLPITIAALGGSRISEIGMSDLGELPRDFAGLKIEELRSESPGAVIRGFGVHARFVPDDRAAVEGLSLALLKGLPSPEVAAGKWRHGRSPEVGDCRRYFRERSR